MGEWRGEDRPEDGAGPCPGECETHDVPRTQPCGRQEGALYLVAAHGECVHPDQDDDRRHRRGDDDRVHVGVHRIGLDPPHDPR